jgi:predicted nucleic acid-binding protein
MSGKIFLLDTNVLVYALKGLEVVKPYFNASAAFISVITEIELMGVKGLSEKELKVREAIIDFCTIIPFTNSIKNKAIHLKQQSVVKFPDAVIAATAITEGFTLVTADTGFKRFKELSLELVVI